MSRLAVAVVALLASTPAVLAGQQPGAEQEQPPPVLAISSYVCPQAEIEGIADHYETYVRPIEQELVAEGMMISSGLYFHAWADEWNVNYYRIVPTFEGLFASIEEVAARGEARNPQLADAPSPFAVCTAHKDNIYFMGPSTDSPDSPDSPDSDGP